MQSLPRHAPVFQCFLSRRAQWNDVSATQPEVCAQSATIAIALTLYNYAYNPASRARRIYDKIQSVPITMTPLVEGSDQSLCEFSRQPSHTFDTK